MKLKNILLLVLMSFGIGSISAQDVHYSLFDMSPLTLNPALTGSYSGTVRVGGLYRNQGFTVSEFSGYSTPSIYVDAPISQGFRKEDWVGVGLTFVNDQAGVLKMTNQIIQFSGSYHFALDKKRTNVITLGLQGGSSTRKYLTADARPSDIIDAAIGGGGNTSTTDQTLLPGNGGNSNFDISDAFTDYSVGLMYRGKMKDNKNLEIGASLGHVSFDRNQTENTKYKPNRINAHAIYSQPINEQWSIEPKLYFQSENKHQEIAVQAWGGYQLQKDVKLNMGLGYRVGDAAQVLFGADYKDYKAALAFDLTLSSLSDANSYVGGLEFAIYKIFSIYKEPVVKPAVLCPRF